MTAKGTKRTDSPSGGLLSASHVVYGLRLVSNAALPGLPLQPYSEVPDVLICLKEWGSLPSAFSEPLQDFYTSANNSALGQPNLRACVFPGAKYVGLFYGDGVRFAIECRGREVWADWPDDYALEDACTYLLGPVMGFVLRLRGTVCLHASAVAIGDCAVALVGVPGAGKSTTAAAFACTGFPVLSDDVVALTDKTMQFLVQPGYPRVNLWPDSVVSLFGSEDALPRITPTWNKRYMTLGQDGHHFASNPLLLGAIYILDSRDGACSGPVVEEASAEDAFMALVANTYVNYLLDQEMRRIEFDVLSRLVSKTPIRRVRPSADPTAIFGLCDAVATDASRVISLVPARTSSARE